MSEGFKPMLITDWSPAQWTKYKQGWNIQGREKRRQSNFLDDVAAIMKDGWMPPRPAQESEKLHMVMEPTYSTYCLLFDDQVNYLGDVFRLMNEPERRCFECWHNYLQEPIR